MMLLCLCVILVSAFDLSLVRSKLSICTNFDVLHRDDANMLIHNMYNCMEDTRLFRISEELIDSYFRDAIDRHKNAIRAYELLNHEMVYFDRDSRRSLRSIQRSIVGIRMNVLYLIAESGLPALSHLANEREIRRIREYLISNAKTLDYLKSIPMVTYLGQLQNITHYVEDLSSAVELRDSTKRNFEAVKTSFIAVILSKYVL